MVILDIYPYPLSAKSGRSNQSSLTLLICKKEQQRKKFNITKSHIAFLAQYLSSERSSVVSLSFTTIPFIHNVLAHWRQAPGAVRATKDNIAARNVTGADRRPVQRFVRLHRARCHSSNLVRSVLALTRKECSQELLTNRRCESPQ